MLMPKMLGSLLSLSNGGMKKLQKQERLGQEQKENGER